MDFLDPQKKRAHFIRLSIGYVLVAIALGMATLILVLLSYGYDLDRKTGTVIQNGLVFISAQPAAADVYVNGTRQGKTNTKLVLPGGQYSLELKRADYRTWSRTVSLQGGSVERFDYPLLLPTKLTPKDIELYGSVPLLSSQSPDRHWELVEEPGQLLKFDLIDLTIDSAPVTAITLPTGLVTPSSDANQSWQPVEWASDNRHVLLRHHFDDRDEFVMLDRQTPASSFNVGQLFGLTPTQVTLRDKKFDQLYLYANESKTLQVGDVKAVTVTTLLNHVLAYKTHDDKTVLYVSDDTAKPGQVALKLYSAGRVYTLRQLPVTDSYLLDVAKFDNHWYMVASAASENRAYIYRDPEDVLKQHAANVTLLPAIVLSVNHPEFLTFSDSARFVAVQSGSSFAVYDAENDRRYYYNVTPTLPAGQKARWMDGNHLTAVTDGKALIFDFDGTNGQLLMPADPTMPLIFNPDFKWLYVFGPSVTVPGRSALTRTDLVVK